MKTSSSRLQFLLILLAAAVLAGCGKASQDKAAPQPTVNGEVVGFPEGKDPPHVRVADVLPASSRPVIVPGRLVWNEDKTARVYVPFGGRIDRVMVAVGDVVKAGQALALVGSAEIGQAQSELHKAEADHRLARQAAARTRDLVETGVMARKELDQAEADLARAASEEQRARARLAQYGISGAAGSVTQALSLVTPTGGVVVERNVNPGLEVRTDVQGPPLFVVSDPSTLWAQIEIDETQLGLVSPGRRFSFSTAAWPDERFEATVLAVGELVDPNSRKVKVLSRVANTARKLKAEMYVSAQLPHLEALPQVPADAVVFREETTVLFVALGQGRYERRPVKLRAAGPQYWSVVEGVKEGERIVVGGAVSLNQLLDDAK